MNTKRLPTIRLFASLLALSGLLFVTGCDWRASNLPQDVPQGWDLSNLDQGVEGWYPRQVDKGRLVPPDTLRIDDSLWMEIQSVGGEPSRWRRKVRWRADEFPRLTWKWALSARPDSGDYLSRSRPATVMAVDVTLASAFGFHKTIRYSWSARSDQGAVHLGDGWHPKVVVLRDAHDSIGLQTESVDVWNDFARLWGFRPRYQALSIALAVNEPNARKIIRGRFGPIFALSGKEPNP
ncbi:MAG: DUF3047 domain-containing protein [Fibrobacteres bacterium]|nr:DUF3047 domain-containing protein [Fibrobacterota bacterium]